jgi:hypothetical protein
VKKSYLILVIILSFIVITIVAYLFLKPKQEVVVEETPQEKIEKVVLENTSGSDFKITHVANNFARGEITQDGTIKDFYLVYTNGEWRIVSISEEPISCEKVTKIGIPNSMAGDCLYLSPKAKTPSQINLEASQGTLDQDNLEIIGDINLGDDPFSNSFAITDDSGESVSVNLGDYNPSGNQDINDNDYVVVDVNVVEDENGDIEYVVEDIEEINNVGDGGSSLFFNMDNSSSGDDSENSEDEIIDISNLQPGEIPDEFYQLLIDRNFDEEIQIISDF